MEAEARVASCENMLRSIAKGEPRVVLAGLLAAVTMVMGLLAAEATAGRSERPADELTRYVAQLRSAAKAAESARSAAADLVGPSCAAFGPAATQVADAAASTETVFRAYRNANTRYGTQEEILLIAALATDLREARGHLARAAGETTVPSQADQRAAGREVSLFQSFVALKIQDRLEIEGLADLLTARSFAEIKTRVVSELQRRIRNAGTAELRRITELRISLNVPLKQQLRDFLEGELSRALSKLVVSAGPAGIIVSVIGGRIVSLIGAKLMEALRQKGNLAARTKRSIAGFGSLQQQMRQLPKDATLTRVRSVARTAERALNATAFLEEDLRRVRRSDLVAELHTAKTKLEITLNAARVRFLLDSALFGEDFGIAIRYAASVRADVARLTNKLGCQSAGPAQPAPTSRVACTENRWTGTWKRVEHGGESIFSQSSGRITSGRYTWFGGGSFASMKLFDDCRTMTGTVPATRQLLRASVFEIHLVGRNRFTGTWRWATTPATTPDGKPRWDGTYGGTRTSAQTAG